MFYRGFDRRGRRCFSWRRYFFSSFWFLLWRCPTGAHALARGVGESGFPNALCGCGLFRQSRGDGISGVYLAEGREIFHFGPVHGTNNIGEFLAIVHALALLDKQGTKIPIYSDSATAISWVRRKQCRTQLARTPRTEKLYEMIARAEAWLKAHRVTNPILKWETSEWGEIPADFGRK